jgi:hypothetical protein
MLNIIIMIQPILQASTKPFSIEAGVRRNSTFITRENYRQAMKVLKDETWTGVSNPQAMFQYFPDSQAVTLNRTDQQRR